MAKKRKSPVPEYRRCPLCHGRLSGTGTAYATRGGTRYYRCTTCGHTWTVRITVDVQQIESREVDFQIRRSSGQDRRT